MAQSLSPQQLESLRQNLIRQLFQDPAMKAYAVLDGAANPGLLDHLYGDRPDFVCLYRGELEPDMAECAPYLVQLQQNTPFTQWLSSFCWGKHWGIFVLSRGSLRQLRQHFRKLSMVYDPETHQPLLFRYYDPRVLRIFLPSCDPRQLDEFFGPVAAFVAEAEDGENLATFYPRQS